METDPTRAPELMIGRSDFTCLGVEDGPGGVAKFHVETVARSVADRRAACPHRCRARPGVGTAPGCRDRPGVGTARE